MKKTMVLFVVLLTQFALCPDMYGASKRSSSSSSSSSSTSSRSKTSDPYADRYIKPDASTPVAETQYFRVMLQDKQFDVSTDKFIEKELKGKVPDKFYCSQGCGKNINYVFFMKDGQQHWFWSKDYASHKWSEWTDFYGIVVKSDTDGQIISLASFESQEQIDKEIALQKHLHTPDSKNEMSDKTKEMIKHAN